MKTLNNYTLVNVLLTAIIKKDNVSPDIAEARARKLTYALVSGMVPNNPPRVAFSRIATLTDVTDIIRPSVLTVRVGNMSFSITVENKYSLRVLSKEIRTYYGYAERAKLSLAVSAYVKKHTYINDTTVINNRVQSIVNNIMGANAPLSNLSKILELPIHAAVNTPAGVFNVLI